MALDCAGDVLDPRYNPEALATLPHQTAVEMGWLRKSGLRRYKDFRKLVSVEREAEIMRLYHRGYSGYDIAELLGINPQTVYNCKTRAIKRTMSHAGADKEREVQLGILDRVTARLMEEIDPDPVEMDGVLVSRSLNTRAVDSLAKILTRRAALTGADKPTKHTVDGTIDHKITAAEDVNRVTEYMTVIDLVTAGGYGSGLAPVPLSVENQDAIEVKAKELTTPLRSLSVVPIHTGDSDDHDTRLD